MTTTNTRRLDHAFGEVVLVGELPVRLLVDDCNLAECGFGGDVPGCEAPLRVCDLRIRRDRSGNAYVEGLCSRCGRSFDLGDCYEIEEGQS